MEQFTHKLAGLYSDEASARDAYEQLRARGLAEQQLRLIGPNSPEPEAQLEPEREEIPRELGKDMGVGAAAGAAVGTAAGLAAAAGGIAVFVAQPVLTVLVGLHVGTLFGGTVGAVKGLKIKEDAYAAITQEALKQGHWVVVAHGRNEEERDKAHQVFQDTTAEREVRD